MHYRYRETVYHINVLQMRADQGKMNVTVDGVKRPDKAIALIDDHRQYAVEVRIPVSRIDAPNIQSDIKMKIGAKGPRKNKITFYFCAAP